MTSPPVSRLSSPVSLLPSPVSPLSSPVSRFPSPVSPEFDLLCRLLPVHFRGGTASPAGWGAVDPEAFRRFVATTQVAPHAFHIWEHTPALWEATPFETRARLVAWQELLRHRLQARFEAWRELLADFAAAGLPVIALKGFVLSQALYGDPFRRVSCDVDLLVRPEDRARADALLVDLGFDRSKWLGTAAASESEYTRPAAPGRPALLADLHWDVVPRWHFLWQPLSDVWDRAVESFTAKAQRAQRGDLGSGDWDLEQSTIRKQNHEPHEPHEMGSNPQSAIRNPQLNNPQSETRDPQSGNPQSSPEFDVQRSMFNVQRSDSPRAVSPFRRFAASIPQAPMILSPADMAWFAVVNNVSDYGLGNLRGCVEALELLALLDGDGADRFRERAARAHAGRTLAALEAFRRRFFPGSREDTVARFAPAPRLLFAARFCDERLYVERRHPAGGQEAGNRDFTAKAPRPQSEPLVINPQSAIRKPQLAQFAIRNPQLPESRASFRDRVLLRLALAGPTPRFLRFALGKIFEWAVWRVSDWKIRRLKIRRLKIRRLEECG